MAENSNIKIIGISVAVAFVLGAGLMFFITRPSGPAKTDVSQAADRAAAQRKLQAMISNKQRQEAALQAAAAARQAELDRKAAEAAKPHYEPARVQRAAKLRQWANITIPEYNLNGWMRSRWVNGSMQFRMALLGSREGLEAFCNTWPKLRITLADQGGTNMWEAIIATPDLHWSNDNGGQATKVIESTVECPLEVYEHTVQWNLKWEQ